MRRICLIALLALAAGAPPAAAAPGPPYPGEAPSARPIVYDTLELGKAFWLERGLDAEQICPAGITVLEADALPGAPGAPAAAARALPCAGDTPGRIWLLRWLTDDQIADVPIDLCANMTHEVGHALGLPHSTDGIMAAYPNADPWPCRKWARRLGTERALARAARRRHRLARNRHEGAR